MFRDPSHSQLPSCAAMCAVELHGDRPLFGATADIKDCFHCLAVPDALSDMFTLPAIGSAQLGLDPAVEFGASEHMPVLPCL